MKNYNNLILDIENDFYLIKINRPKFLNALNQETIHELRICFEYINSKIKFKMTDMIQNKINTNRIAICLPSDACYTRIIEIPEEIKEDESRDFLENPDSGIQIPISPKILVPIVSVVLRLDR